MDEYRTNKRRLVKLMSSSSFVSLLTRREQRSIRKGHLPFSFNCHHIRSIFDGGGNGIDNLAIMLITKHRNLHIYLDSIREAQPITKEDRPWLLNEVHIYGGFTAEMA